MQATLLDYIHVERNVWQIPLHEYLKLLESRELPENSMLSLDLSQETPESLVRFTADQLELLCLYWGAARSGTKAKKIDNLLNTYKAHQTIAKLGKAGLFKLTVPELKKLYRQARRNSGSWHVKRGLIESLLAWRENVHEPFLSLLSRTRHHEAVSAALRLGKPVPDIVMQSSPAYVVLYRKTNGLPIEPEQMVGEEWAALALQAMENRHMTDREREIERHWHIIERAIKSGKRLRPEVMADHERQTSLREAERQKALPRGPNWKPADLRAVEPGDTLYRTDGVQLRVVEAGDRVLAFNVLYGWEEELEDGYVWLEAPFHIGDKVRWKAPNGQVRVGRIKHARPRLGRVFGEEFFILTGGKFKGFDHPEFFTAPVGEVEKEEAII